MIRHGKVLEFDDESAQVAKYHQITHRLLQLRAAGRLEPTLLGPIGEVMARNPDFYTLWSWRREIVTANQTSDLLLSELKVVRAILKAHPKVYAAWSYRAWLVTELGVDSVAEDEKKLVRLALSLDTRNFHVWNYYTSVFKPDCDEILSFIRQDFSNHTAWHHFLRQISSENVADANDILGRALILEPTNEALWMAAVSLARSTASLGADLGDVVDAAVEALGDETVCAASGAAYEKGEAAPWALATAFTLISHGFGTPELENAVEKTRLRWCPASPALEFNTLKDLYSC